MERLVDMWPITVGTCLCALLAVVLVTDWREAEIQAPPQSSGMQIAGVGTGAREDVSARAWNTKKFHEADRALLSRM
jgi:hypothetical protein